MRSVIRLRWSASSPSGIDERNVGGSRSQYAVHYLDWLEGMLSKPVFVVAFRNPVAIARTILRRVPTYGGAGLGDLGTALEYGIHRMWLGDQIAATKAL
jgi:hypothetical protein